MSYFLIYISILCLLLQGVAQLLGRWEKKRLLLSFLLVVAAGLQFHFYLLHSKLLLEYPIFFLSYIPLLLCFGPAMRFYFNSLSKDGFQFQIKDLFHCILPAYGLWTYVSVSVFGDADLTRLIHSLYEGLGYLDYYLSSFLCGGSVLVYAALILREQPRFFIQSKGVNVAVLFGWVVINVIFVLAMMISFFSGAFSVSGTHVGNSLVSVVFVSVFLIHIRHPRLFREWLFEVRKTQRSRQYLGSLDPQKTLLDIRRRMEEESLYANSELSLQSLAELCELTRYQLSELLNDYAEMSFYDFVASYRVEAAKSELSANTWKKVISVGLEVGFNSQATFNKTFKKWTGFTPSEYQKLCLDT